MQKLYGELGEMKLELSNGRKDLSISKAMKSQLESEIHDLCKDYEKKSWMCVRMLS